MRRRTPVAPFAGREVAHHVLKKARTDPVPTRANRRRKRKASRGGKERPNRLDDVPILLLPAQGIRLSRRDEQGWHEGPPATPVVGTLHRRERAEAVEDSRE